MSFYRYIGQNAIFYGTRILAKGDLITLPTQPNQFFQPIENEFLLDHLDASTFKGFPDDLVSRMNVHAQIVRAYGCKVSFTPRDCDLLYRIGIQAYRSGGVVFDFASGWGFTTHIILLACKGMELFFCERAPESYPWLDWLIGDQGHLFKGDVNSFLEQWPSTLDLLVIDADHSTDCAQWYIDFLWPRVRSGGYIWLHDMYDRSDLGGEYATVKKSLERCGMDIVEYTYGQSVSTDIWEDIPHRDNNSPSCALALRKR